MFKAYVNDSRMSYKKIAQVLGTYPAAVSQCMHDQHIKVPSGAILIMEKIVTSGLTLDEWVRHNGIKTAEALSEEPPEEIPTQDGGIVQVERKAVREAKNALKIDIVVTLKINGKEIQL